MKYTMESKNGKTYNDIWMQTTPYMGKVRVHFMNKEKEKENINLDKAIENSNGYYLYFNGIDGKKKYLYLDGSKLIYSEVSGENIFGILNSVDIINNTINEVMWMVDNVIDDVDDTKNNKSIEIKGNIRLMVDEIYANAKNKAII